MSQSTITFNLQLVCVTLACILCVLLPFSTARIQNDLAAYEEIEKRDIGVRLCQANPKNCPGGPFFNREPVVPITREERQRAAAILRAGEELKRSLRSLRNGLRAKLFELLRPSFEGSSEESKEV